MQTSVVSGTQKRQPRRHLQLTPNQRLLIIVAVLIGGLLGFAAYAWATENVYLPLPSYIPKQGNGASTAGVAPRIDNNVYNNSFNCGDGYSWKAYYILPNGGLYSVATCMNGNSATNLSSYGVSVYSRCSTIGAYTAYPGRCSTDY